MRNNACARRAVLRALAGCATLGSGIDSALAQPPGRAFRWWRVPPEKPRPPYLPMVVLDPGHGGVDPGAIGPDGVYEKNIVYATARYLARDLAASGRFQVALTRGPDEFVPLHERVAKARTLHADLFLAIHADALPDPRMHGLSVFTLSAQASDRQAAALADSENQDLPGGLRWPREPREVSDVLIDLERRETDNSSLEFAGDVVMALGRESRIARKPAALGRVRGAYRARYPFGSGRAGLPVEPGRGAPAGAAGLSAAARPRPGARDRGLFRVPARPDDRSPACVMAAAGSG